MKNKKILIVGSNSDIAKSLKSVLSEKNAIVTVSRKKNECKNHYMIIDYSKDSVLQMYKWYKYKHKNLDILIILNGFGKYGKISEIPLDSIDDMVNANLLTPYYFLHYFTQIFLDQNYGNIILMGSVAGIKYSPGFAMYSATKFGLRALSEAYRNEFQNNNIKITNIQPGFVDTKFWENFADDNQKFNFDEKISVNPNEIANTIKMVLNENDKSNYTINELTCRSVYQER